MRNLQEFFPPESAYSSSSGSSTVTPGSASDDNRTSSATAPSTDQNNISILTDITSSPVDITESPFSAYFDEELGKMDGLGADFAEFLHTS